MTFKEVVKDTWVNMDNVVRISIGEDELVIVSTGGKQCFAKIDILINTPEHWRNWLEARG